MIQDPNEPEVVIEELESITDDILQEEDHFYGTEDCD